MLLHQVGALLVAWVLTMFPAAQQPSQVDRDFPVLGGGDYVDAHHDYPATDIFAECGSTVVSPVDGSILEVTRVDRWDADTDKGSARGGRSFSVLGRDGVRYYGSHLSSLRQGLRPGTPVTVGERIGRVGHSGSARPTPCHLHFGISPACDGTGQWWIRRGSVSPYRFLRSWEAGGSLSPAGQVSRWQTREGCPRAP